jgi:hypothetical protein
MSMKATEQLVRFSATFVATVDLPEPDPPAMPIMSGLSIVQSYDAATWNALCPSTQRTDGLLHSQLQCFTAGSAMKRTTFAIGALICSMAACNAFRSSSETPTPATSLRVDNEGFADMTVYAARSAQRVRLGLAPGHTNRVFTVPQVLINGLTPLRFIADPIGGARPSVSEEITVAPGDSVVLTIPPI